MLDGLTGTAVVSLVDACEMPTLLRPWLVQLKSRAVDLNTKNPFAEATTPHAGTGLDVLTRATSTQRCKMEKLEEPPLPHRCRGNRINQVHVEDSGSNIDDIG